MASDGVVQVPADSVGKKIDTSELTRPDTTVVERQRVTIGDPNTFANQANVTAAGALQIDGSAVTQPVVDSALATKLNTIAAILSGTLSVTNTGANPLPISFDDRNVALDDDGNLYVNPNVPGADIATGANQQTQTAVLQQIAAGTPVSQQGNWSVGVTNFPPAAPVNVTITNTEPVVFAAPQPVYLDDQNVPLDDNGYQFVNTNFDGSDVSTASQQAVQTTVLQQISAGVPVSQQGPWNVGATVNNFPASQNVNIASAGPIPVYLDDQNNVLDDNGIQYVNTNVDGADISTGANQLAQTTLLQSIAAGAPVSQQGAWSVAISSQPNNLPPNASLETAGQLQRIADLMEAVLLELRVNGAILSSLGQNIPEDAELLRRDLNLTLQ